MTLVRSQDTLQEKSFFLKSAAVNQLQKLAKQPIRLSDTGHLTKERLEKFVAKACGYKLLYGTELVTDEVLQSLKSLADERQVLEKMKQMQAGEIMNFIKNSASENRPALHTALRDLFDHPQTSKTASEAAFAARQEIEKLKCFMARVDTEKKFDEMIVIGIGGSDQGPRANVTALQHLMKPGRKVYFIANVDPDDAANVLNQVNLKRTLIVVISKSGTTIETETNEELVKERYKKEGLNPFEHLISVTMPGTPMDNPKKYVQTFHLWDWVGGRYSTTSMVGGVILSFAFGFDVFWEFLRGAHDMDRSALEADFQSNLPLLIALIGIWNHSFLKNPTFAVIPYSQALRDYPAHFQQVDMESNGKLIDQEGKFVDFETGPVVWGSLGTNAQHSYFQLLHQGTATIPLLMIGFKKSQYDQDLEVHGTTSQEKLLANLFAQSLGLALGNQTDNPNKFCPGNRPTSILLGNQLTPYSVGALLALYEHKVAVQGFIWGINSFDQEGVQLGKIIANRLINRFADKRKKSESEKSDPLGDAYLKQLENF